MAIFGITGAEEASISTGSTFSEYEVDFSHSWTRNALSNGCYKCRISKAWSLSHSGTSEFALDMPSSHTIVTIFVVNLVKNSN